MLVSNGIVPAGEQRESGSEVAVLDERVIGAVSVVPPSSHIETVNVTKSTKVHVGTKVVSITQNVHNKEMLKGKSQAHTLYFCITPLCAAKMQKVGTYRLNLYLGGYDASIYAG